MLLKLKVVGHIRVNLFYHNLFINVIDLHCLAVSCPTMTFVGITVEDHSATAMTVLNACDSAETKFFKYLI